MKRCYLLALLFLPQFIAAQSVDLKAFGGMMMNSGTGETPYNYKHSKLNALGGIGAAYRHKQFEFGLSMSYRRFSFQKTLHFADEFDPATGFTKPGTARNTTYQFNEPAIVIAPAVNMHFSSGRLDWYAGLSPAYVRYTSEAPTSKTFNFSDGTASFAIEGQAGCSYEVLPRVRCFAEISGGSFWIPYYYARDSRFWTGSLNLGAQLRLWEKAPKLVEAPEDGSAE